MGMARAGVGLETVAAIWVFGPYSVAQCVYEKAPQQQPKPTMMELPQNEEEEPAEVIITFPSFTEDTLDVMDDEEIFRYVPPSYHNNKKRTQPTVVRLTPTKKRRTTGKGEEEEEDEYALPFTSSDTLYNHTFAVAEPFPISSFFPSLKEEQGDDDDEAMVTTMEPAILTPEPTPEEVHAKKTKRERCFRQMSNHLHSLLALFDNANPRNHTINVRSLVMGIADGHEELRALGCLQEFEATHPTLVSGVQRTGYYPTV